MLNGRIMLNDQVLKLIALSFTLKLNPVFAWSQDGSYDAGEDDERVVKVLLPLIACAIMACVIGCYVKKHCNNEDEENKKKKEEEDDAEAQKRGVNNFAAKRAASKVGGGPKAAPPSPGKPAPYASNQQRGSVTSSEKVMLHQNNTAKQVEGRTMSQNSAHSSGAGSSGYQSNSQLPSISKATSNNPTQQKRPSVVSTVNRDTKPRQISNTMTNKAKPALSVSTSSRAQSTVAAHSSADKHSLGGSTSVYAEISTPSMRAPNAQALVNNYSSSQNLPGDSGTMRSDITTVTKHGNAPKRTFSQPQITSMQNRASGNSGAAPSRGYSTLKPYERNCHPN